ncbi:hypothetical protein NHL50_05295 [Acidimicrobiia bacterium EGI L10123]|uniref:hypothetical protein n=1 Tax=Salinilacustrithrix flava TaxID=2957203 RepID=UPI003D7C2ADC|nr:hypothetical protein [Acidimicrobiia bacterium EGI L10123]
MAAGRDGTSRRDRALAWVAPLLLLAIAAIAVVRHHTVDQSPWQGVGFGMFSSYDYLPSRTARLTATVDGETTAIALPNDLRDELERVLVAPGDDDAVALAEEIMDRSGADAVRLQVLGHDVDDTPDGLRITLVPIRTVDVP